MHTIADVHVYTCIFKYMYIHVYITYVHIHVCRHIHMYARSWAFVGIL